MGIARGLYDDVSNSIDYLQRHDLCLYANAVAISESRDGDSVGWYAHQPAAPFLITRDHPDVGQYVHWLKTGNYSAILMDGSILQLSYTSRDDDVIGHRLAYIPCPYVIDNESLRERPVADLVEEMRYRSVEPLLRSPLRVDYDVEAATDMHPAAHLTINSVDCRIACVGPMHARRFCDLIFRHFYPGDWQSNKLFFDSSRWMHVGNYSESVDSSQPHLSWNIRLTEAAAII